MSQLKENQKYIQLFQKFEKLFSLRAAKNDFFRIRSSQNTVQSLESLDFNIEEIIDKNANKLTKKIPGIGKASEEKIIELYETGSCKELDELFEIYPESLLKLMNIKGLGPKKVLALYQEFQVETKDQLKDILQEPEKLAKISIKAKTIANLKEALEENYQGKSRINISEIYDEITNLLTAVKQINYVTEAHVAGSFRRLESTIGDIDIIITCKPEHIENISQEYIQLRFFKKIINQGQTKITAISQSNIGVDLRMIEHSQLGACLQYFTGNRSHNIQIRQLAKDKGMKINEYGLFKIDDDSLIESANEVKIYELLGLQFVPPTLRSGTDEIKSAQSKTLEYVDINDIKNSIEIKENHSLVNGNKYEIPGNIFRIPSNKEAPIEETVKKMQMLGKKADRLFVFDEKNTELAIQLIQKSHLNKKQILNCLNKEQLSKVLI